MKSNKIICVIDDDNVYKYTITKMIERNQLAEKLLLFSNGEEALSFFDINTQAESDQKELPDVVFLDVNMPIMDGWEFLEEYVKLSPKFGKKITLYMISSSVNEKDLKRAERISAISDYIVKPINGTSLINIINEMNAVAS